MCERRVQALILVFSVASVGAAASSNVVKFDGVCWTANAAETISSCLNVLFCGSLYIFLSMVPCCRSAFFNIMFLPYATRSSLCPLVEFIGSAQTAKRICGPVLQQMQGPGRVRRGPPSRLRCTSSPWPRLRPLHTLLPVLLRGIT